MSVTPSWLDVEVLLQLLEDMALPRRARTPGAAGMGAAAAILPLQGA